MRHTEPWRRTRRWCHCSVCRPPPHAPTLFAFCIGCVIRLLDYADITSAAATKPLYRVPKCCAPRISLWVLSTRVVHIWKRWANHIGAVWVKYFGAAAARSEWKYSTVVILKSWLSYRTILPHAHLGSRDSIEGDFSLHVPKTQTSMLAFYIKNGEIRASHRECGTFFLFGKGWLV